MSTFSRILGQERQIDQLERARSSGRVAHAYLFHGPEGVGKELVALAFAQALNCTAQEDVPCGGCSDCEKTARGNHPDVRLVASEEELVARNIIEAEKRRAPSAQIRNVQLDELADLFRHRPYLGRWKVVVVVDAHKMNTNSQNRFLKTLEEPSADSVIILVTAMPEALLPTVRSRCQGLGFGAVGREKIAEFLQHEHGAEREHARVIAAMAQGSFGRALNLIQGDVLSARDRIAVVISRLSDSDMEDLLGLAEECGRNRTSLANTLELLELWCRDLLLAGLHVSSHLLVNQDRRDQLEKVANRISSRRLISIIERIRQTRNQMKININPRMAVESLLLSMRAL